MKSKTIIIFFVVFLGGGILFTFGMIYFLSHVVGIDSNTMSSVTNNIPEEFKPIKWIIGGAGIITVLGTILSTLLPIAIFGFVFYKFFGSKWKSLGKTSGTQNPFSGNTVQDIFKNFQNQNKNTTTVVNDNSSDLSDVIKEALHNAQNTNFQNTGTQHTSGAGAFPGIILPMNMQQTNNTVLQTQAPADIMLRIQASGTLLNELKANGGIPTEAKIISQEILFENAMPDINAVELKYQIQINGMNTFENTDVILTPKTSMFKSMPGSIIHVLYNANNPKRMAISGTDKSDTTIKLS